MSNRMTSSTATQTQKNQAAQTTQANQTAQVPHDKIAMRAYEKWCKRGRPHGTDKLDWTEAETELRAEMTRPQGQTTQQRR